MYFIYNQLFPIVLFLTSFGIYNCFPKSAVKIGILIQISQTKTRDKQALEWIHSNMYIVSNSSQSLDGSLRHGCLYWIFYEKV